MSPGVSLLFIPAHELVKNTYMVSEVESQREIANPYEVKTSSEYDSTTLEFSKIKELLYMSFKRL